MKRAISLTVTALIAASALCGCSKSATTDSVVRLPESRSGTEQSQAQQETTDGSAERIRTRASISGVRRHFKPSRSGNYTVEYIHAPYGIDKDETLDYKLTLNDDNSFSMTVVSDGVTAEHSGRWYERRKEIMLFYDEQIEQPAHNVYVSDSMFGDLLPKGKIMIYDNCYTIVLSQSTDDAENK